MKTRTLNYTKTVLLFFGAIKYAEYQRAFDRFFQMVLREKMTLTEFVFTDPKGLFLDNKTEEPVFMSLEDVVVNDWKFKQEKYLKWINWNAKLFFYCEKRFDSTFYHVIGSKQGIEHFKAIYSFKSWSITRNLTKKERSFIYKFINGYFKNRYSYNFLYWEELQDTIKELEEEIMELGVVSDLVGLSEDEEEEMEELKALLKSKKSFEDKLLYSISEEVTSLGDYLKWEE